MRIKNFEHIMLKRQLDILRDFIDANQRINRMDFDNVEQYNEEIYDDDGDFIEIGNQVLEKYVDRESLLIKTVFYELNTIREKIFQRYTILFYHKNSDYLSILSKILGNNSDLIDYDEIEEFRNNSEKLKKLSIIDLMLIFGSLRDIPKEIIKQKSLDNVNFNKKEYENADKAFREHIKNIPQLPKVEEINSITNALKHRDGIKDFRKDETSRLNERYELSLKLANEYIDCLNDFLDQVAATKKELDI